MKCVLGFILASGMAAVAVLWVVLWLGAEVDGMVETDWGQDE